MYPAAPCWYLPLRFFPSLPQGDAAVGPLSAQDQADIARVRSLPERPEDTEGAFHAGRRGWRHVPGHRLARPAGAACASSTSRRRRSC